MKEKQQHPVEVFADHPASAHGDDALVSFSFDPFARTLAGVARNPKNDTPITVVVRGSWGRGKTTLLRLVEKHLARNPDKGEREARSVWFNAWKYPSETTVLAGLLGALLAEMRTGDMLEQLKELLARYRNGVFAAAIKLAAPWTAGALDVPDRFDEAENQRAFYDTFERLFAEALLIWQGMGSALRDTTHVDLKEKLRGTADKKVLAVFLDDLDRCNDKRVLDVLEAINLFLDFPGVVFYLGIDRERLEEVLKEKTHENAAAFMEKIQQVTFDLPAVTDDAVQDYAKVILKGRGLGDKLDAIKKTTGVDVYGVLSEAIPGNNPRTVKRFLNDLSIAISVMEASKSDTEPDVDAAAVFAWHLLLKLLPDNRRGVRERWDSAKGFLNEWKENRRLVEGDAESEKRERYGGNLEPVFSSKSFDPLINLLDDLDKPKLVRLVNLGSPAIALDAIAPGTASKKGGARTAVEWIRVPGGTFQMGSEDGEDREKPVHEVTVSSFEMSATPITNSQYRRFVDSGNCSPPDHWEDGAVPSGLENHPVVNVSYEDATRFCEWLQQEVGGAVRLPREGEWEYAARGPEGRLYPWGNEDPDESRANFGDNVGSTTDVRAYDKGRTPEGLWDMSGNVWEWCFDWFGHYEKGAAPDPVGPPDGSRRVVRGGSWDFDPSGLRASYRGYYHPDSRNDFVGFRVVRA